MLIWSSDSTAEWQTWRQSGVRVSWSQRLARLRWHAAQTTREARSTTCLQTMTWSVYSKVRRASDRHQLACTSKQPACANLTALPRVCTHRALCACHWRCPSHAITRVIRISLCRHMSTVVPSIELMRAMGCVCVCVCDCARVQPVPRCSVVLLLPSSSGHVLQLLVPRARKHTLSSPSMCY